MYRCSFTSVIRSVDIELLKSREVQESEVPGSAIRLFAENVNVNKFNQIKIDLQVGTEYISVAKDTILGQVSDSTRQRVIVIKIKKDHGDK